MSEKTSETARTVLEKYDPEKFELGQFDKRAYAHGQDVVERMRSETAYGGGPAHSVCVAIYVDGYLQFAGADAYMSEKEHSRYSAKEHAWSIIARMNQYGEIAKGLKNGD
jgi:hypothetical protein